MGESKQQVAVIGNIGIDTNIFLHNPLDLAHEANFTENMDTVGQAGGFASRAYARLGLTTSLIGYIGADFLGEYICATLARDGIGMDALFIDPRGTSRSINLVLPDGSRRNFYDGKSHMSLQPPLESCLEVLQKVKFAHFNIPNWARQLLQPARELGAIIACDIQDVVDPFDSYRRDFVQQADYLFFSAVNHPDPAPVIHVFLEMNPRLVILATLGSRGVALGTLAGIRYFPPVELDLPVVDTNGAGDAFATGFMVSCVVYGCDLVDAVTRGQICARYKCAQKSTSDKMITSDLLERYFATVH